MNDAREYTKVQELVYEMKVAEVMTREVATITPDSLMSDLRIVLRDKRISGMPVVEEGRLVGLVSLEDFIKWLTESREDLPVRELMHRNVVTLYESEPLVKVVEEFDRLGFGRFPVVSRDDGKLVGIVTKGDIVRGLLKRIEIEYHEEEIHLYRASHLFEDIIADRSTLIFEYRVTGGDFDRAGDTSSRLKKTLRRLGIPPKIIRRVAIAAYEAEMNIVVFTDGGDIIARVTLEDIVVEAIDKGPGIGDIEKAMKPGFSTASDWVRALGFGAGMGLPNIKKCSDEMLLESDVGRGTRLKFTVRLNGAS